MGEIKSTLELVMEKTSGMTMSAEEKKQLKEEQAAQRAKGLFLKHREGFWSREELQRQVERDADADEVRKQVSLLMIDSLDPSMTETTSLTDMKTWLGSKSSDGLDEAAGVLEEFQSKAKTLRAETEDRILSGLKKVGIWGSAVKPKVHESGASEQTRNDLETETNRKLENIKQNLRKLL